MSKSILVLLAILCAAVVLASCDNAEKQALKIFTDQGLTILQPARDYVTVGGLVILPKTGGPVYADPYDAVATTAGTATNFQAIIQAQTKNQSNKVGASFSLIQKLLTLPIGLDHSNQSEVKLDQINASGSRLVAKALDTLITKTDTQTKIKTELGRSNRVFVVQEVYTAKSLSLTSTKNAALNVKLGNGALPSCEKAAPSAKAAAAEASKASGASAEKSGATTAQTKTAAPTPTSTQSSSASAAPSKSASAQTKETAATPPADSKAAEATGNTKAEGSVAIGVCRTSDYTLTLQSDKNIPIAVRLAEIQLLDKTLAVKYGSFKFPGTLGASDIEKSTALLGTTQSVLSQIRREVRSRGR